MGWVYGQVAIPVSYLPYLNVVLISDSCWFWSRPQGRTCWSSFPRLFTVKVANIVKETSPITRISDNQGYIQICMFHSTISASISCSNYMYMSRLYGGCVQLVETSSTKTETTVQDSVFNICHQQIDVGTSSCVCDKNKIMATEPRKPKHDPNRTIITYNEGNGPIKSL